MNNITITGNLTRDPELKFTEDGKAICNFDIAVYQGKDKEGNNKKSLFIECSSWEMESVADLPKGTSVTVSGILKQEYWDKDGEEHSKFKIIAKEVAVSCTWQKVQSQRVRKEASAENN